MATKKTTKDGTKSGKLGLTAKERESLKKSAEAEMKKHGFKTPEELIAYRDKTRGY